MNQRDATIDVGSCRLAARCLQVRLPDVPEIGSGVIVVVAAMRMRLREQRERSGKNEREQDTNGEPPCFQGGILAPFSIGPPMRR
jgi:small neutral amino acid transporter SnatA (MarC family)